VDVVGIADRELEVLLDEEHGQPVVTQGADRLAHCLDVERDRPSVGSSSNSVTGSS
jgi:hypothetical protein